jgi:hypothetical protein
MGVSIVGRLSPLLGRRRRWLRALLALAVAGGVATAGASAASAVAPSGYLNPLRAAQGLLAERIDQGVDYVAAGRSPVYALGDGTVTNVYSSGWPNGVFLVYQLSNGPAEGLYAYVAEDVKPAVSVGQQVTSRTVLARFEAGADGGYDIEMGWADPCSCQAIAATYGQYPADGDATAFGRNFNQLMTTLGAPAGVIDGPKTGSIPRGWPVWGALKPVQDVFFAGANAHLYQSVLGSRRWHWSDMCPSHGWGCTPRSPASVAVNPSTNDRYVLWRGPRGDIVEAFYQSGAWHGPFNMCTRDGWGCGVAGDAPDVGVGDNGNQYVIYLGGNGDLYQAVLGSRGWRWSDMCTSHGWGCALSSPAGVAVNPSTNDRFVFWRGRRGDIFEAFYQSGAWHGPIDMCTRDGWGCGVAVGAPDVGVGDNGNQYVIYLGGNGHLYQAVFGSRDWRWSDMCTSHGWGCKPSSSAGVAVSPSTNDRYVFWRGPRSDIVEAFYRSGAWHRSTNVCTSSGWGCGVAPVAPSVAVSG